MDVQPFDKIWTNIACCVICLW